MSQEEKREIGKASLIMAFMTLLSRVLGLVRNQLLGHYFGAGLAADAFVAAFRIPNALRRLFGEGALTPALVATFTRALKTGDGKAYLQEAFTWLSILLVLVCGLGMLMAEALVRIYVPNFSDIPGKVELTVQITRFVFPFILFIGWSAFFMGILNSVRRFALPAFGPAALNIFVVIAVPACFAFVSPQSEYGIFVFAGALVVGGLIQAIMQIPQVTSEVAFPRFVWRKPSEQVLELGRILIPSAFAMGVYQLNIIVNGIFASRIDGAVSHLFYADLILELPVSLIAVSLGTAVLPSFSRLLADNKISDFCETLRFSLESVWLLALPSMVGILVLSEPIVSTLYLSGKFTLADRDWVSSSLNLFALGLPFFAGMRILSPAFFAQKNTRTPALVGFAALAVNFVAAWSLSPSLGAPGIALATTISSVFNFFFLAILLSKHFPKISWMRILSDFSKTLSATIIMGLCLWLAQNTLNQMGVIDDAFWNQPGFSLAKALALTLLIGISVVVFFAAARILGIPQAKSLQDRLTARLKRRRRQ